MGAGSVLVQCIPPRARAHGALLHEPFGSGDAYAGDCGNIIGIEPCK